MADLTQEEINEIHRVMTGENAEEEIETQEGAYRNAIGKLQNEALNERRGDLKDEEWNAAIPLFRGQTHFHTGETESNFSQLYSSALDGVQDLNQFSRKLESFSQSYIMALGKTPKGDEVLVSDSRNKVRKTGGLKYRTRTGRNVSVELEEDSLKEIDYRNKEIENAKLRKLVLKTQKDISSGLNKLEKKGFDTPAPPEVTEKKISTNYSLQGYDA